MTPTLKIYLLGEFRLVYGETAVTTCNAPRLQALLAYLVLHRHAPQSRHHLAFLLWPDSTEAQALANLRNLLHRLREALPEADRFLEVKTQTLQWRPDTAFGLDVADFENGVIEATSLPALREAVALYRGDLLPGCYDEWLLAERDRLRQRFIGALARLSQMLEDQRDYQTALRYARRLLGHDPLDEATYRRLMRLQVLSGNRAGALRAYHTCATVLRRELGVEPDPATHELYQGLLNLEPLSGPVPEPVSDLVATSPLVGRVQEWSRLQGAWREATRGGPHFVSLAGEAGIGKTRLAEELLEWARRQGIPTARTRAYAAEGRLAYAPVVAWLGTEAWQADLLTLDDIWLTEVARLRPELLSERPELSPPGPLTETWQRQHLFEALARAVLAVSGRQPLLLQIDDLQWCDRETLEWLHYLLRFDPRARLLLMGTFRPEETGPDHPLTALLLDLRRHQPLTEIELGPLDATETASLATHVAGQELDPVLAPYLYQETEGNPLFVIEMVRAGLLQEIVGGGRGDHDLPARLPPTVQAVITARLTQLSAPARQLAGLPATIGRAFTFDVLAQASGEPEETLVRELDELWQCRIIREHDAEAYDFSHDKIREVAYTALRPGHRRLLHRRVAQALETLHTSNLDAVSGQVGAHYERAGSPEQAIAYYQRAAEVAQRIYANEEAITYFQWGLALLEVGSHARFTESISEDAPRQDWRQATASQLYEGLGDVLALTGQHQQARDAFQSALDQVPPHNRIWQSRLHRKLGKTWEGQEQFEATLQRYEQAEATLGQSPVETDPAWGQEWVQIHLERLWIHYFWDQLSEMAEWVEIARPLVEQYGTPSQRASFFQGIVSLAIGRDRYVISEETLTYAHRQLAVIRESGNTSELAFACFLLGFVLWLYGNLDQTVEQLHTALRLAERIGDPVLRARCLSYLAVTYRRRGQVETVRDYASRSLEAATAIEMTMHIGMTKANLAWLAWRTGDLSGTLEHGQTALTLWRRRPVIFPFQWAALWPLIGVTLTQDQLSRAMDHASALLEPSQQLLPETLAAAVSEAIQAWEQGQPETARRQLAQAMPLAQEMGYL